MCARVLLVPYAVSIGPVVQKHIEMDGVHFSQINIDVYVMIHSIVVISHHNVAVVLTDGQGPRPL